MGFKTLGGPAGVSGDVAWGDITGSVTNQSDLQSTLDAKAAILGADDNYVTDAEKTVIGNTSNTNTGDQVGDGVTITGAGIAGDPFVGVDGGSSSTTPVNSSTGDGTTTFDFSTNQIYNFTFGVSNETFTFTAPATNGVVIRLKLIQDGTGGRTVAWPAGVEWSGGSEPTLSTAGGGKDWVMLIWDGTTWNGYDALNFATV